MTSNLEKKVYQKNLSFFFFLLYYLIILWLVDKYGSYEINELSCPNGE